MIIYIYINIYWINCICIYVCKYVFKHVKIIEISSHILWVQQTRISMHSISKKEHKMSLMAIRNFVVRAKNICKYLQHSWQSENAQLQPLWHHLWHDAVSSIRMCYCCALVSWKFLSSLHFVCLSLELS